MKKKVKDVFHISVARGQNALRKKFLAAILIVIVFVFIYIWWSSPIYFLKDAKSDEIIRIEVFNGNTGNEFVIENNDDIDTILSNIQSIPMKKQKISLGYMGTLYNLKFIGIEGNIIDEFILNNYDSIRKDPFMYIDSSSSLCVGYLNILESGDENYVLKSIYGVRATVENQPPEQNKTKVSYEIIISGSEQDMENIDKYELVINDEYRDLLLIDGPHNSEIKDETDPYLEIVGSFVFDTEGKTQDQINAMDFLQDIKIIDKDGEEWSFDL